MNDQNRPGNCSSQSLMDDLITVTQNDSTVTLTLNRPAKRNALSLAMRDQLLTLLETSLEDRACGAIILTGAGAAFCAGADLAETGAGGKRTAEERSRRLQLLQKISERILLAQKPVIAAVNGAAFGVGLSFVAACDAVVAVPGAEFCAAFSRVGLFPDGGIVWTLPRRIGYASARRMLMTGERVSGEAARAMGLCDQLVEHGDLLPAAHHIVENYRYSAPLALGHIKRSLARDPLSLEAVFSYEAEVQQVLGDSEDCAEAKAAFFEKRPPRFRPK